MSDEYLELPSTVNTEGIEKAADEAGAEIDRLRAQQTELVAALRCAVRTIRVWHGMGMSAADAAAWSLYQASPEMKQINAALAKAEDR